MRGLFAALAQYIGAQRVDKGGCCAGDDFSHVGVKPRRKFRECGPLVTPRKFVRIHVTLGIQEICVDQG